MKTKYNLIGILSMFLMYSCASTSPVYEVELTSDATVTEEGNESKKKAKSESFTIKDSPVFVEAPGKVSIYLVPLSKSDSKKLKLNLKDVSQNTSRYIKNEYEKRYNNTLYELVSEVSNLQTLFDKRDFAQIEIISKKLQEKFPNLSFLSFYLANAYLAQGKNDLALKELDRALNDFPEEKWAINVYEQISGKKYVIKEDTNEVSNE